MKRLFYRYWDQRSLFLDRVKITQGLKDCFWKNFNGSGHYSPEVKNFIFKWWSSDECAEPHPGGSKVWHTNSDGQKYLTLVKLFKFATREDGHKTFEKKSEEIGIYFFETFPECL